jgi:hypothetical protein
MLSKSVIEHKQMFFLNLFLKRMRPSVTNYLPLNTGIGLGTFLPSGLTPC